MLACSIRCFEHLVVSNRSGLLDHYWGREDHHRSSCFMSEIYFHQGDQRSPMVPWSVRQRGLSEKDLKRLTRNASACAVLPSGALIQDWAC